MFAVVFIPDFSLQAVLRLESDLHSQPVALIDPDLPKPNIVQLTSAARAKGVVEGLTSSQAMARCANLLIKTRSLNQEQAVTDILLQTAYAFSPNIEATAPGVCTMELKGLGLEDEAALTQWAEKILQALTQLNLRAQMGISITPSLALMAAHAVESEGRFESEGRVTRVPEFNARNGGSNNGDSYNSSLRKGDGDSNGGRDSCNSSFRGVRIALDSMEFVSPLPIAALNPSLEISNVLERWGVRTIGALIALGKSALADRLGPEAVQLLNRISPRAIRPLKLVTPKPVFEEQMEFEHEIETFEPLLFVLRRFIEQLARRLEVIHLVIAEIQLQLKLGSGAAYEHRFRIPSATGNVETLFRMVQTHLETLRTDSPIVALRIEVKPCPPQTHQFGLFETTLKDPNQFAETLARLTALCGSDRVGTPVLESTHRPDMFRMKTPEFDQASRTSNRGADLETGGTAGLVTGATGLCLRRFRPAISAFVEFRERRPALVRSSVFNGAIVDLRGPFVSSGDWWDRDPWSREEWDVQTAEGTLYRIFSSPEGCFVEGVYD
ncbi:MAG TPA: DNA polymerase Y family protein [Verrucomicrobiae bacterium]|nr:DNA polymerase Y family protein [Verrucomicrobiae bacterium]